VGQHHYLMRPSYLVGRTLSGLRTWDGVRVVDYLLTRPEIDPQRIAVGGNSGGGQMTLLITACHPQVACCAAAHPGGSQENTYLRGQWLMDLRIISLIPPRPCRWIVGDQSGEEAGHRSRYDHLQ
jgi:dienelactone hydrolase